MPSDFLDRHRDLLAKIHALEAAPLAAGNDTGPAVTRPSLQADLTQLFAPENDAEYGCLLD